MSRIAFTYELKFNGRTVAEMDGRLIVDTSDPSHPIEVEVEELGTYRSGQRYVAVPEPVRSEILAWAWETMRDQIDEAFMDDAHGRRIYAQEIQHAAE